jgi:nucleoid-associated protein YgaU
MKYYTKQLMKPVSLVALTIGFVGVLIGAAGLFLAVRYGKLLKELEQQTAIQTQTPTTSQQAQENIFPIKYQVTEGDSTWKIAQKLYGDGNLYPSIEQANNLKSGQWLEVGSELVVPSPTHTNELGNTFNQSDLKADSIKIESENYRIFPAEPNNASGEKYEKYVIQPGDTLWFIALKYLDSGYRWNELYSLNNEIVGTNPNLIYPGMVLLLPTTDNQK